MLKKLLCGWFLLPGLVLGSIWTGTVTVAGRTDKLVIQIDKEGCHVFITDPVSVNTSCTITEATGTEIAFRTTSPEADWVGQIRGTAMSGDFRSARRLLDEAGSDSGAFSVQLEGSPASSGDRRSSAVSPPDVRPPSERVVVWHDGDKRFYDQGIGVRAARLGRARRSREREAKWSLVGGNRGRHKRLAP
jgi:hypothetical protein